MKKNKFSNEISNLAQSFHYYIKAKNWIDPKTGEIFIDVTKEKKHEEEMKEIKNLRELKKYFRQF